MRRGYERFAAEGFGTLGRDNLWLPALSFLAQACAHVGDPAGASELRALLSPISGRNVVTPDVAYIGPVDRYLALVAAAEGDLEGAVALFASARGLAQAMGARPDPGPARAGGGRGGGRERPRARCGAGRRGACRR